MSWTAWETAPNTDITVSGDPDWGKGSIDTTPALSGVVDTGDTLSKTFTVICPKYGTNEGTVTISIRGSTTTFNQHDATPEWATYTTPVINTWRYVQLRMVAA